MYTRSHCRATRALLIAFMSMGIGCSSCEDSVQPTPEKPADISAVPPDVIADTQDYQQADVTNTPRQLDTVADIVHVVDGAGDVTQQTGIPPACDSRYGAIETSGDIEGDELLEVSGIVAATHDSNVLWAHNDSGDSPRIFALSTDGTIRNEIELKDISALDYEDIARSLCPNNAEKTCLWIADIGNNLLNREVLTIYGFEEPDPRSLNLGEGGEVEILWTIPFSYPSDTVDAEALIVSPDGSAFWIFEKASTPEIRIFQGTTTPKEGPHQTLSVATTFSAPGFDINMGRLITAADLHPNEKSLAIRVYTGSYEYRMSEALGFGELSELSPLQIVIGPLDELQGEAIAYGIDGLTVWTCSEDPTETGLQPIHYYPCGESSP